MFSLSINKPCGENWDKMSPAEQGAFCVSCSRHVVDFTGMPDESIIDYFQKKKEERVCGRFRIDQLNRPLIDISPAIFAMKIPFWKKFLAALFICFSAFITGCSVPEGNDYTKAEVPTPLLPKNIAAEKIVTEDAELHTVATSKEKSDERPSSETKAINRSPFGEGTIMVAGYTVATPYQPPCPHLKGSK